MNGEPPTTSIRRVRLEVDGIVQGVGFRPFVHRIAHERGLVGWVRNDAGSVVIEAQGPSEDLDRFLLALRADAPPLAVVASVVETSVATTLEDAFRIAASASTARPVPTAPPDTATCDACLDELADPGDRRYRHPFITCTDCGPRFTIITGLPYDRPVTTMAGFPLCVACEAEYTDTTDRRHHAQPIACHDCGPSLSWTTGDGTHLGGRGRSDEVLATAQRALAAGAIVAVKGIGGWHLACRADDEAAVRRLRDRKHRPHKPLALLARDLDTVARIAVVGEEERRVLASAAAPIVLLRRRATAPVAPSVAPDNPFLGVQLASNPLHHLLLTAVPGAATEPPPLLVLTSGNLAEEPICTDDGDARDRLGAIADSWLGHDRPIAVPCDDSVVRVLDDGPTVVRRSRGFVPVPVVLPVRGAPALALGGELKATTCLTDGRRAWLSQHIGDMGGLPALRALERTVARTGSLHDLRPDTLVADDHPGYTTHTWARRRAAGRRVVTVQHHHAHVAALLAEHGRADEVVGVAFDGTGYGTDGTIWGGEVLVADLVRADRVAHLAPVPLPGGDAAIRHPRRVALSHLRAAGVPWEGDLPAVAVTPEDELELLATQLERGVAQVPTTSMGRLFDAVSSLLGVRHDITYEAQAAIELELLADAHTRRGGAAVPLELPLLGDVGDRAAPARLDPSPLVRALVAAQRDGASAEALALGFHVAVAEAVRAVAVRVAAAGGPTTVGLTGGVFANALLVRLATRALQAEGLTVLRHRTVPTNDGGLALGQAAVAVARTAHEAAGDARPPAML